MNLHEFIPQEVGDHGGYALVTVAIAAPRCPVCRRPMVANDNFAEQAKRAGWPTAGKDAQNAKGQAICDECAAQGHARFRCARDISDVQETFGGGWLRRAEYLCKPCFVSVPAAQWLAKARELEDDHRHDFE